MVSDIAAGDGKNYNLFYSVWESKNRGRPEAPVHEEATNRGETEEIKK